MNEMKETPPEIAAYITRRMMKEIKKYKTTEPFHSARGCQSKRCVWHNKKRKW